MDPRIIDLYNEELLHLRSEAAEFAREFPDRAAALALDDKRVEDPYVERLLEGVAYLAARVRLKLNAQYPLFTQQLLDVLFPGWLDPTPSACVLRVQPDAASGELMQGVTILRGTPPIGYLDIRELTLRQTAQACARPVLIRVETRGSHAYRPTDRLIAEKADQWAFAAAAMGMK